MSAIPTTHRYYRMRSRLEATWAAFFDALGWPWEYEPIDLDGYIPDFVLKLHKPVLVEVKPVLEMSEFPQFRKKIDDSGWKGQSLIVGATIFDDGWYGPIFGEMTESSWEDGTTRTWEDAEFFTCLKCGKTSFLDYDGKWDCRVCGAYEGNHFVSNADSELIRMLWARAKNSVQWHPGRAA